MKKIGMFYGTNTVKTALVAKEIKDTPIEKMTTDQKAKLSLIKNFVNSVNLILMTQGTQLPFSKDFVKALDAQIKELK